MRSPQSSAGFWFSPREFWYDAIAMRDPSLSPGRYERRGRHEAVLTEPVVFKYLQRCSDDGCRFCNGEVTIPPGPTDRIAVPVPGSVSWWRRVFG